MTRLIAYLSTPGGLTGAPRRVLTLASVLTKNGLEVCIASPSDSDLIETADAEGQETVALDPVGVLALRGGALSAGGVWFRARVIVALLRQNLRLLRCIRQRKGDVLWVRGGKGIAFGALGGILSRRPLIWDVDYEPPSRGVVRCLHRIGLWAASAVVFQYSAAPDAIFGRTLAARYRDRFRVIIPGIDLPLVRRFRALRERRDGSGDDPFVILQVGSIGDRKNQQTLIEAVAQAIRVSGRRNIRVRLAGEEFDQAYAGALREMVSAHGLEDIVEFLGWRSDVHDLMVGSDLLAMPSRDEGVPNAVQEAMAVGLPVAVSDVGGLPEIVANGETGWVLGADNAAQWAERIQWCIDHPDESEAIGRRGSAYAVEHFGAEHWGPEYARVIAGVVEHGTGQRTA